MPEDRSGKESEDTRQQKGKSHIEMPTTLASGRHAEIQPLARFRTWYAGLPGYNRCGISTIGIGFLLTGAALFWSQFNQVRPTGLGYSRAILALLWLMLFLASVIASIQLIRYRWLAVAISAIWPLLLVILLDQIAPRPEPIASPAPLAVSLRLGCEWDQIPIRIAVGSSIRVLELNPGTLISTKVKRVFLDQGSFQTITNDGRGPEEWPSKRDGRWLTKSEIASAIHDASKAGLAFPSPFAFRCTMKNYTSATLDEIVPTLWVDTPGKKFYSFAVPFDPLMPGSSFSFYVVNMCSSGVIPVDVQWDNNALVHVLGEKGYRRVPLRYERQPWPSSLMLMGRSSFVWSGMGPCRWKTPS